MLPDENRLGAKDEQTKRTAVSRAAADSALARESHE
jgi:hypothetical protein